MPKEATFKSAAKYVEASEFSTGTFGVWQWLEGQEQVNGIIAIIMKARSQINTVIWRSLNL